MMSLSQIKEIWREFVKRLAEVNTLHFEREHGETDYPDSP